MKKEMIKTFTRENTPILEECFKILERFEASTEIFFFEELGHALDIISCGAKTLDFTNLAEVTFLGKEICDQACKVKDINVLIGISGLVSQVLHFTQMAFLQIEKGSFSDVRNENLIHKLSSSHKSLLSSHLILKAS